MPKMTNGRIHPETGDLTFIRNEDLRKGSTDDDVIIPRSPYLFDVYGENVGVIDFDGSTLAPFQVSGYNTHLIPAVAFNGTFGFSPYVATDALPDDGE